MACCHGPLRYRWLRRGFPHCSPAGWDHRIMRTNLNHPLIITEVQKTLAMP